VQYIRRKCREESEGNLKLSRRGDQNGTQNVAHRKPRSSCNKSRQNVLKRKPGYQQTITYGAGEGREGRRGANWGAGDP